MHFYPSGIGMTLVEPAQSRLTASTTRFFSFSTFSEWLHFLCSRGDSSWFFYPVPVCMLD